MGLGNATDRISVSLYEDRSVWHETNLAYISEIEKTMQWAGSKIINFHKKILVL